MVLSNVKSLLQYLEHDSNLERKISDYQGNKDRSTSQRRNGSILVQVSFGGVSFKWEKVIM